MHHLYRLDYQEIYVPVQIGLSGLDYQEIYVPVRRDAIGKGHALRAVWKVDKEGKERRWR